MNTLKHVIILALLSLGLLSCSTSSKKVPENQFIGIWEFKGSIMLDGLQVSIENEENSLVGRVYKLNDNRYVRIFVDSNEVWIPTIKRISYSEFRITENLVGNDLFQLYGLGKAEEFRGVFINQDTIGLAKEPSDPKKATTFLIRIK